MKNQNVYFLEKGAILIENNGSLKKSLRKSNLKKNNLYILDYRNSLMKRTKKKILTLKVTMNPERLRRDFHSFFLTTTFASEIIEVPERNLRN